MSLLMAGGLEPDDLQGSFQPLPFCDSMILYVHLAAHRAQQQTGLPSPWYHPGLSPRPALATAWTAGRGKPGPAAAQDTGASGSPAPMATVKASPQATTLTFIAWSPTTRWGTRLLRQELVPSCPCWLLPKV